MGSTGLEGALMSCPLCASGNQAQFAAEMDIHLSGLKNVNKPTVLLFSNIVVPQGLRLFANVYPES